MATKAETIDLTPTWGEWGNIFYRLVSTNERYSVENLRHDLAKAMAAAQAFAAIQASLTAEQATQANNVLRAEMKKQGFVPRI
jgi:hypothetical protein